MSAKLSQLVRLTQRRHGLAVFLRSLLGALTLLLVVAAGLIAADQLLSWPIGWPVVVGVACTCALLWAAVATYLHRLPLVAAASNLDAQFGLKERASTLSALHESERELPAARALADDLEAKLDAIDPAQVYPLALPRWSWLPAVPALAIALIVALVGPLPTEPKARGAAVSEETRDEMERNAEQLARRAAERRQQASEAELGKELEAVAAEIDRAAQEISNNKSMSPDEAALKLSDLSQAIEKKREDRSSLDRIKQALSQIPRNAAEDPLSQALRKGDFKAAAERLEELQKKLAEGNLSTAEKKELAENLAKLKEDLKKAASLESRAKELEKGLSKEQAEAAQKRLEQQMKDLQSLQQLAQALEKAANEMGQEKSDGSSQQATAEETKRLTEQLAEARKVLDDLARDEVEKEMLNQMLDDVGRCRGGMCQKPGKGDGLGAGTGKGDRPEEETATRSRDSRARSQITQGKTFVTGTAEGPLLRGDSQAELREAVTSAVRQADESITRQPIPREFKDHTREYFQRLNRQVVAPTP